MPENMDVKLGSTGKGERPNASISSSYLLDRDLRTTVNFSHEWAKKMTVSEIKAVVLHEAGHIEIAKGEAMRIALSSLAVGSATSGGIIADYANRGMFTDLYRNVAEHAASMPGLVGMPSHTFMLAATSLTAIALAGAGSSVQLLNTRRINRNTENEADIHAAERGGAENMYSAIQKMSEDEEREKKGIFTRLLRRLTDDHPTNEQRLELLAEVQRN